MLSFFVLFFFSKMSTPTSAVVSSCDCWLRVNVAAELHLKNALIDVIHNRLKSSAYKGLPDNPNQGDIAVAEGYMNTCISNCCDSHIDLIPKIMRRMKQAMEQV